MKASEIEKIKKNYNIIKELPDISMCLNKKCPMKDKCYRYKTESNMRWQTYSDFNYEKDPTCFLPLHPNDELKTTKRIETEIHINENKK